MYWGPDNNTLQFVQVQIAVDTRQGVIQIASATHQQQSLAFLASVRKTTATTAPSRASTLSHRSQAVKVLSKLLHAPSEATQQAASVFGSTQMMSTGAQQQQGGLMGIEASLQLANIGLLGLGSPAAASVGPAVSWAALQMCPSDAAASLQFTTVGTEIGSAVQNSGRSSHSIQSGHGRTVMLGVVTKPMSALHESFEAETAAVLAELCTGHQPVLQAMSSTNTMAQDSSTELSTEQGVLAETVAAVAQQTVAEEQHTQLQQPAIHARLLAMDAHERRMFIQAQVCCWPHTITEQACGTLPGMCTFLWHCLLYVKQVMQLMLPSACYDTKPTVCQLHLCNDNKAHNAQLTAPEPEE